VTTESFYRIWTDRQLRQKLVDYTRSKTRKSHDREMQQDLLQEGWIAISLENDDASPEYLFIVARKAMDARYKKEWRYREHIKRYLNPSESRYPGRIP